MQPGRKAIGMFSTKTISNRNKVVRNFIVSIYLRILRATQQSRQQRYEYPRAVLSGCSTTRAALQLRWFQLHTTYVQCWLAPTWPHRAQQRPSPFAYMFSHQFIAPSHHAMLYACAVARVGQQPPCLWGCLKRQNGSMTTIVAQLLGQ